MGLLARLSADSGLLLEWGPRLSLGDMGTTTDLMTVAGLASRVGVKPDTVRYHERTGLLPAPRRMAADHRRYDASAVDLMRFIQGAQRIGLRLADIRQLVALGQTGECPASRPAPWCVSGSVSLTSMLDATSDRY
jgi:DNA-binding transcriptional MerR regulator